MKFTFVEPRIELKPYIRSIWIFESPIGMPLSSTSLAAPNGCSKFVINYENSITSIVEGRKQDNKENGLYFAGNRDISVHLNTPPGKTGFIGIEFHPHGAYPFLGIPMGETSNHLFHLEVLLSKWGKNLSEILSSKESVFDKINFIQDQLTLRLREKLLRNSLIEYCVNSLKHTNGMMKISDLEDKTGYSRRYLEILFKNHIGFSPKTLATIFRFQKFYRKWATDRQYGELKEELYDHYFDQAHFVKEFKRMTGFSPQRFIREVSNEFGRKLSLH